MRSSLVRRTIRPLKAKRNADDRTFTPATPFALASRSARSRSSGAVMVASSKVRPSACAVALRAGLDSRWVVRSARSRIVLRDGRTSASSSRRFASSSVPMMLTPVMFDFLALAGCRPARFDDDLRAFANLAESLQHLGPDRLLTGTARARDRDLQLIWLFLCCVVCPEAGDHAGGYEAIEGDVDQTAPGAIALGHLVPPCQAALKVTLTDA